MELSTEGPWYRFRYMEDIPPSLQPQPVLAYDWCWQCIRSYGQRMTNPADSQGPNSNPCNVEHRRPYKCSRCRDKNLEKCQDAESHIPIQFRRAVNILCAMRQIGDGQFRAQGGRDAERVRSDFYTKFARYAASILRAIESYNTDRKQFLDKFGELAMLREERKELKLYLHNFERVQLGMGEVGNPKPANFIINREIEADFLANATEEDLRRLYYGEMSSLPIRIIEQRKQANTSVMHNGSR